MEPGPLCSHSSATPTPAARAFPRDPKSGPHSSSASPTYLFPMKVQFDSKWVTHSLWRVPSFRHASALEGIWVYQPHLHFASEGKGLDSSDPGFASWLHHVLAMGLWASDSSTLPLPPGVPQLDSPASQRMCVGAGGSGRQQLLKRLEVFSFSLVPPFLPYL